MPLVLREAAAESKADARFLGGGLRAGAVLLRLPVAGLLLVLLAVAVVEEKCTRAVSEDAGTSFSSVTVLPANSYVWVIVTIFSPVSGCTASAGVGVVVVVVVVGVVAGVVEGVVVEVAIVVVVEGPGRAELLFISAHSASTSVVTAPDGRRAACGWVDFAPRARWARVWTVPPLAVSDDVDSARLRFRGLGVGLASPASSSPSPDELADKSSSSSSL